MASNESKIPVGQILVGKYSVIREIGRGGMAAVYEAEQLSLGKKVAVKVLAAELSASTIVIERFFREARAAASIKSPYIVDVYDSGRLDDGRPFITMEMLEGESLYDRMARIRLIEVDTTVRVIVHSAKGLMKAHAAGIVHRDLKPENIFLTKGEDGEELCKILDFGLAKFYAPVNPEDKAQKRLTREGAVFGTPAYMSPEQVKGQGNVDHRADLWALGCMAFECLIGRPVWNMDQGVAMTFASIATGPIPVPSQIRTDLPPSFDAWFKKCLERDPNRRYQTAKELADAFVESWGQRPSSSSSFTSFALPGAPRFAPTPGSGTSAVGDAISSTLEARDPVSGRRIGSPGSDGFARSSSLPSGDASAPIPLVTRSSGNGSAPEALESMIPRPRVSAARVVLSSLFFVASAAAAVFVWTRFLNPQVFAPIVQSKTVLAASAAPSGSSSPLASPDDPKWVAVIADGQKAFSAGDAAGALKKFQDAIAMGDKAAIVGKVFQDQVKFATSKDASGPCKTLSFARPRTWFDRKAERPAILATSKGDLFTWTDDHEQEKKDHIYGVLLDTTGKAGPVRDLTPEASDAQRPQLLAQSADRTLLLWWDRAGRDAGVRVRFLDSDGRIDANRGQSVLVGSPHPGDFWPSMEKSRDGYIVVWQDDRDKDKEYDLFARRLTNELETNGLEARLTDYHSPLKTKLPAPRVRFPSVAVAPGALLVAYRLDKEHGEHTIVRLREPLDEIERGQTLLDSKDLNRDTRVLGNDVAVLSEDKAQGDAPAIACGKEGCFAVWHGDPTGAWVAAIDPNQNKVQWRKRFDKASHPSLAVNSDGVVAIAFYESNKIKMAYLSRDGVSAQSTLLHINDDQKNPRPSIAAGTDKSEWTLAWQDADVAKGPAEVYAARVVCR